ncbi:MULTISPECIES: arsenate reductase ArsC [Hymenobacter]|uniref:Protein tyrosine phosphatase n=1 Tax=Hymenobacter psychrotolerans DSM 18569 TaxID=1121959 RepID=A0A1M6ZNH3_9BACT|nr:MULTISPECIES: arsenate reductase ArsC [Hymenobacter]QNE42094.1 arsenate reductase ArsC [Hymenobacter sp. NBH84]SHL32006.1 protein tyrosine phosphatase [Hymenobacter psychrotolerans DSM 18569]
MKPNILVLCTGNSCRSQLLHGYLEQELGDRATVYSAGVEVHGLNPRAVQTMAEDGVDISHHTSNHVDEYAHVPFDYVLTVCDHANEVCPVFTSTAKKLHHNFPDPAKATGTEEEIMAQFRTVRDQVKVYAHDFVQQELATAG